MKKTFTTSKGSFLLYDNPVYFGSDYPTEFIGKVSSLTEEQCKGVVDEYDDIFDDYFNNDLDTDTNYYKGLFNYLLESLGLEQTDLWLFKIIEK